MASEPYRGSYRFDTRGDESAWHTIQRIAEEVGWTLAFDDQAVERLRATKVGLLVARADSTRDEFVAMLCSVVGVRYFTPVDRT